MSKRKKNPKSAPRKEVESSREPRSTKRSTWPFWVLGLSLFLVAFLLFNLDITKWGTQTRRDRRPSSSTESVPPANHETRYVQHGNLTLVWDSIKPDVRKQVTQVSTESNICRKDYVGPESCKDCHAEKHRDWSSHPHRWMNAYANEESVVGDFGGEATIEYRGGIGRFYREGETYLMRYDRKDLTRVFEIHQTIGSRYHQYYVGIARSGPEPKDHPIYKEDSVLPFGYWIAKKAWVPIVHVHSELPDGKRWESIETPKPLFGSGEDPHQIGRSRGMFDESDDLPLTYARACNFCHTTFPLGDMFIRMPETMGHATRNRTLFAMSSYVAENHPEVWDGSSPPEQLSSEKLQALTGTFVAFDAPKHGAMLGIGCEACHLGGRHHAANKGTKQSFLPEGPHLFTFSDPKELESGKSVKNSNSVCARCHFGERPRYAAGMSTWNSTEFSDAIRGSCYSQLACTSCHDPHKATGLKWSRSPNEDDQSCIKCHPQFTDPIARKNHTHHAPMSNGDRCMNCHMPHINEGMEDTVRTHTIFSPTNAAMLESNQPNACNLCHLDQSIDWTLGYLKTWYGKEYDAKKLDASYSNRKQVVGMGWLEQKHEPTRLAAIAAIGREKAEWAIPKLIDALDDPFMMNRQFAQSALEKIWNKSLNQSYGYWYHMSQPQRGEIIEKIRNANRSNEK